MAGRGHYYEHGRADAMRPALETLKALGVGDLILTNAAGSLREDFPPGAVMLITDHINFGNRNPLIGEASDARFVGMTRGLRCRACASAALDGRRAGGRGAAPGRLHVVLRPELRDAGGDPRGAHRSAPTPSACRPCRR